MKALFITLEELKRKSIIDGNVDTDKLIQFVEVAQDTYIQTQLGTVLYDKLQTDIKNSTLSGNYSTLVNTYLKPMLIWFSQSEYMKYAAFQISNGGVFKHISENAESVSKNEIDYLVEKERDIAEYYTRRFIDYMTYNQTSFPEYTSNSNEDIDPDKDALFNGWVL